MMNLQEFASKIESRFAQLKELEPVLAETSLGFMLPALDAEPEIPPKVLVPFCISVTKHTEGGDIDRAVEAAIDEAFEGCESIAGKLLIWRVKPTLVYDPDFFTRETAVQLYARGYFDPGTE